MSFGGIEMKIRLAILETDKSYLNRIVSAFNMKYADKFEIYSFTEEKTALEALGKYHVDVFLAGETFEIDQENIPEGCGFAYLAETRDITSLHGEMAICKFQKAELIYKQVINIYSEQESAITGIKHNHSGGKLIGFFSASGGNGTTTAAAAFANYAAGKGKKTIYLNLEIFGNTDLFFHGEGQGSFEDVIYAVKSRKGNLFLKLESSVKQDISGVYYFSKTNTALDMNELKLEEIKRILTELRTSCDYEYIVLDFDFSLTQEKLELLAECEQIVMVSDGSKVSNDKAKRMLLALQIIEQQNDLRLMMRMGVLYNRFSSKTSEKLVGLELPELGGFKRYEGYRLEQLVQELSRLSVFDCLM